MLSCTPPPPLTDNNTRPAPESAHPVASPPRALRAPRESPSSPAPRPVEQPLPPAAEAPDVLPYLCGPEQPCYSTAAIPTPESYAAAADGHQIRSGCVLRSPPHRVRRHEGGGLLT